jgi:hypothetical protein
MDFTEQEMERIKLMRTISEEITTHEPAVLKGGTSLLLTRGLNRFSEDIDFDLPKGTTGDFRPYIEKAAKRMDIDIEEINIKKDTETTKRYMVHFKEKEQYPPLKVECSMRQEIDKEDVEIIDKIRTYNIPRMAEIKTEAFKNRNKARDTYDISFLVENYPDKIKEKTWKDIHDHVTQRGINDLQDSFEREAENDNLLKRVDSTEIILNLEKNIQKHQEKELGSKELSSAEKMYIYNTTRNMLEKKLTEAQKTDDTRLIEKLEKELAVYREKEQKSYEEHWEKEEKLREYIKAHPKWIEQLIKKQEKSKLEEYEESLRHEKEDEQEHETYETTDSEQTDIPLSNEPVAEPQNKSIDPARQAAQKISEIESISKSADGLSVVGGADITERQEKYVRDAVKGKQEIQKAETANNARQGDRIKIEMSSQNSMVGRITKIKGSKITIQTGRVIMTLDKNVMKEKNWKIKAASPVTKAKTMEFARERAKEIMGESVTVAGAANDRTYSGKIVGTTEGYAIQALNSNAAVLHKLEDLSRAEKDGKGQIKVLEGESLSITRDALGVVSLTPYDKEREEREKERQRQLQRGSQQIGF